MNKKGFSLIELLIVITIIGILAVALLPTITQGPARARDTQRIADLSNIAKALEMYRADNRTYPVRNGSVPLTDTDFVSLKIYFDKGTIPVDPQSANLIADDVTATNAGKYYYASDGGTRYALFADTETDKFNTTGYYYLSSLPKTWTAGTQPTFDDVPATNTTTHVGNSNVYMIVK